VAHWAKLHGPSSTAFTELLKIDGVSTENLLIIIYYTYFNTGLQAAWTVLQQFTTAE
jgi:hypothetical protein